MSKDLNDVTIIGRLTKDPEVTYTKNSTACTKFSIANNDDFQSNGETKKYANFFDIVVWGKIGENCAKYLRKGSAVAINGSLRQERWNDQQGNARSKVSITANTVQFLSQPQGQNAANENAKNVKDQFCKQESKKEMIEDPWGDNNQQESGYDYDTSIPPTSSDDEIPF